MRNVNAGVGWFVLWGALWVAWPGTDAAGGQPFVRGDIDESGRLSVTDAVTILRFLFTGQPATLSCTEAADVDDDGELAVTDGIFLLDYLFGGRGGEAPPFPFPHCGDDFTGAVLGCGSFDACSPVFRFYANDFAGDGVFFVVDRSGSLQDGGELAIAKQEVIRLIGDLPEESRFGVIFSDTGVLKFPATAVPAQATLEMKSAAVAWVNNVSGGAGSCPLTGLLEALSFVGRSPARRNVIFYVGDGGGTCMGINEQEYLRRMVERVTLENTRRAQINAIGVDIQGRTFQRRILEELTAANGGIYIEITR